MRTRIEERRGARELSVYIVFAESSTLASGGAMWVERKKYISLFISGRWAFVECYGVRRARAHTSARER